MIRTEGEQAAPKCKHETQIKSCGMKVCFDCGAPMNAKAKQIAALKATPPQGDAT